MNETLNVIAKRFSCRGYDSKPVEREKLEAIARAAVQAPSAMDKQPWKIIVITDKSIIDEMDADAMNIMKKDMDAETYQRFMDRGGKLFYNAPVMFVITQKKDSDLDTGIVAENIALAASSLDLGNVICGMARIPFTGENAGKYKSAIGFDPDYDLGMTVLVGYPTVTKEPHEPDMSKVSFI